jgi:hypothetical protein
MTFGFSALLDTNRELSPAQQQQQALEKFPSVVDQSHMENWRPGESLPTKGKQILIGVATYSVADLQFLDALEAKLAAEGTQYETTYLFNLAAFPEFRDFETYFPGIGKVYQTPVMGFWEDGVLKEKFWGATARDWLVRHYRL